MGLLQLLGRKMAAVGAYFYPRVVIRVETPAQLVTVLENYAPLNISTHSARLQRVPASRKHLTSSAGPCRNDLSSQHTALIRAGWMSRPQSASITTRHQQKATRPTSFLRYQRRGTILSERTERYMDRIDARKIINQPRLAQQGTSITLRSGFVSMDEVRSRNLEQARLKKEAEDRLEAYRLGRCKQKADEWRQSGTRYDALLAPGGTLQHWKHPQQPLLHATADTDLDQACRTVYNGLYEYRHTINSTLDGLDLHSPNSFKALVNKLMLVSPTLKEFSDQLCDRAKLSHPELGLGWNWEAFRQVYWDLKGKPSESSPEELEPLCQSISETFALVGLDLGSVVPTTSPDASDEAQLQAHHQPSFDPVNPLDDTFNNLCASSSKLNSSLDALSFEDKHSSDDLLNRLKLVTPILKQLSANVFGANTKSSTLLSSGVDDLGWNWNKLQQIYWILRNKPRNSLTSVETQLAENIETVLLSVGLDLISQPQAFAGSLFVHSQLPSTGQAPSSANDILKQDGITSSVSLDALAYLFARVEFDLSPCTHSDPNYHRAFGQVPTVTISASSSSQGSTSLGSSQASTSFGSSSRSQTNSGFGSTSSFRTITHSSSTYTSPIVPATASGTPVTSAGNENLGLNLGGLSLSGDESVWNATTSSSGQTSSTETTAGFTFKPSSSGPSQRMFAEESNKKWTSSSSTLLFAVNTKPVRQKECLFGGSQPMKSHTSDITSLKSADVDPMPEKVIINPKPSRYNTEENVKVVAASLAAAAQKAFDDSIFARATKAQGQRWQQSGVCQSDQ